MEIKSNLDELIKKFEQISREIDAIDWADALLIGCNQGMGEMKFRIFNEGKDTGQKGFGRYVGKRRGNKEFAKKKFKKNIKSDKQTQFTRYELKRLQAGASIVFKNLELTGGLRRGIIVGRSDNKRAIIYIPNEDLLNIARGQEQQIGKIRGGEPAIIFRLASDEKEHLKTATQKALNQMYDRLFNNK